MAHHAKQDMVGKVAFITGSAKNMGKHFALALARRGADIVIHHRKDAAEAEKTAQEIHALGRRTLIVQGELTSVSVIEQIFAQILATFKHIDIVINNAGVVLKKPMTEISEEEYDQVFAINAKVPFFIMKECAKHMANNGRVINIGTTLLAITTGEYSAYAGSKAPLEDFTRALAKEAGARGITVNTIAPGPIDTPFFYGQETKESTALFASLSVANRLGDVKDIVPVVEFIASPDAQWVTAQTLFVNGGVTSR
ncbi:MAG: dehydrogenase [Linnemannia gamsii]|nr:MAG: dehydrogenase [Linnemannia gamsii]